MPAVGLSVPPGDAVSSLKEGEASCLPPQFHVNAGQGAAHVVSQVEGFLLMLLLVQPKIFGSDPFVRGRPSLGLMGEDAGPWRSRPYGSLTVC